MFMNLHALPAGQHMYTVAVTAEPADTLDPYEIFYDEVDVVASGQATAAEVIAAADLSGYEGQRVVGVIDQTDGYTVFENFASEIVVPG